MEAIVPCRALISDRFPVASFAIRVPSHRLFEVVCATDPRLFHVDWRARRTSENFYSSGSAGLLRTEGGHTTWLLPPDQLRRFAGARRIYFALASYGSPNGASPSFTIAPSRLDRVPCVGLSPGFTGKSLDRRRLGGSATARYGGAPPRLLTWGGDAALIAEREATRRAPRGGEYDDGYDPSLWREPPASERPTDDPDDYPRPAATPAARHAEPHRPAASRPAAPSRYAYAYELPVDDPADGPAGYGRAAAPNPAYASPKTGAAREYEDGADYNRSNPGAVVGRPQSRASDVDFSGHYEDGAAFNRLSRDTAAPEPAAAQSYGSLERAYRDVLYQRAS